MKCVFPVIQEVERGGQVDEEDMAKLIQQLEGRVGSEVQAVISTVSSMHQQYKSCRISEAPSCRISNTSLEYQRNCIIEYQRYPS